MLAANSEKNHGAMEFVFGATRSSVKAWPSEFTTCVLFDIGPLECRIASLLHCISLKRTQDRDHPPPEAFG